MFAVMDKLRDNFFMDIDNKLKKIKASEMDIDKKLEKIKASEIKKSIKKVNEIYREELKKQNESD